MKEMKIISNWEITYHNKRKFFGTFIQMFIQGFDLKSTFHIMFKTSKDMKNIVSLGKNPQNYENVRNETCIYKRKSIKINNSNEAEEKELKERVEKRKIQRREVAKKN